MTEAGDEGHEARHPGKKSDGGDKARKAERLRRHPRKPNGWCRALLIKAIAHPVRRRILRKMTDEGGPISPVQLSKKLAIPLGMVVYHANVLGRCGAVEAAGERQIRGAIEHFYETTIKDDPPVETLLEETREEDEEDV